MRVDDFDFELPVDRIALRPSEPREAALLLQMNGAGVIHDRHIADLPQLLNPGDQLVVNDTKVLPARLTALRHRGIHGAKIAINLHRRIDAGHWRVFLRPAKKLAQDETLEFSDAQGVVMTAKLIERGEGGEALLRFDRSGVDLDQALYQLGSMPLPPYIAARRAADASDQRDYQTIFADQSGAVAAPTAGLHFTPGLLHQLQGRGVTLHRLTLHVGAGTFLPVKVEDTADHVMHAEWGRIDAATVDALNAARAKGSAIIAVGTTSLRLIESASASGRLQPFEGETDIFITPGYRFRFVDRLLTNFHLPRSTLFMLVSAFSGLPQMKNAYAHAIDKGYRFYSYGDACFLDRAMI